MIKKLTILVLCSMALFWTSPLSAQDSTSTKPDSTVSKSDTAVVKSPTVDITNIPTTSLIYTIVTIMGAVFVVLMPAIQLVLKKIPGASPIAGILGGILNVATWWQDNVHVGSSPPKV